jgi:hypothetical protein
LILSSFVLDNKLEIIHIPLILQIVWTTSLAHPIQDRFSNVPSLGVSIRHCDFVRAITFAENE